MKYNETEIWDFTTGWYKISTENKRLAIKIEKLLKKTPSEVYSLKGKDIGWGFIFETKFLVKIKSEIKKFEKETKKSGK